MSKKLHIEAITSDLEGSAFFPRKPQPQPDGHLTPPPLEKSPEETPVVPTVQQNSTLSERVNARTPARTTKKRIITRNSFEIYEDQMDSLRKLSIEEKMAGKLGSMSAMVREAIDTYLQKRSSEK